MVPSHALYSIIQFVSKLHYTSFMLIKNVTTVSITSMSASTNIKNSQTLSLSDSLSLWLTLSLSHTHTHTSSIQPLKPTQITHRTRHWQACNGHATLTGFALVLKIAYSNTRTQTHSQAVVLLVVVLQVRRILLSSNTSSKANYGLCAETGKTAAGMTNFSGFTK